MKLSNQAIRAIMLALQNSLMNQTDITPVLQGFNLVKSEDTKRWGSKNGEVDVENSPMVIIQEPEQKNKFDLK